MQIIAESQPVKSAPYIHLGYLSASSATDAPAFGAGLLVALVGVMMAARLKRVEHPKHPGTYVVFRRSVLGFVGLLVIGLGVLLVLTGIFSNRHQTRTFGEPMQIAPATAN